MNYHKILGVDRDSSMEEIKKAYKKKCMEYHPDRNAGFQKEAEEKMKEVNKAYDYFKKYGNNSSYSSNRENSNNNYQKNNTNDYKTNPFTRLIKVLNIGIYSLIISGHLFAFGIGIAEGDGDLVFGSIVSFVVFILAYKLITSIFNYIAFNNFNYSFKNEVDFLKSHLNKIKELIPKFLSGYQKKLDIFFNGLWNIFKSLLFLTIVLSIWSVLGVVVFQELYPTAQPGNVDEVKGKIIETTVFNEDLSSNLSHNNNSADSELETIVSGQEINTNIPTYTRTLVQNTNFRSSTNTNSNIFLVIKKGETIETDGFFLENDEGKWYEINYPVSGFSKKGYINEIAFKTDEEINFENNNFNSIDQTNIIPVNIKTTSYFDCGIGGTYNDSFEKCFCESGYKTDINGKCNQIFDCGIGGTYNDSFSKCFCESGYKTDQYGKCSEIFDCGIGGTYNDSFGKCFCESGYKTDQYGKCSEIFDCGIGGTYNDSFGKCFCKPGYGTLSDGKCYK